MATVAPLFSSNTLDLAGVGAEGLDVNGRDRHQVGLAVLIEGVQVGLVLEKFRSTCLSTSRTFGCT